MQCPKCGAWQDPEDHFCRNCGDPVRSRGAAEQPAPAPDDTSTPVLTRRARLITTLNVASAAIVLLALLTVILAKVAPELLKAAGFTPRDLGVVWSAADYASLVAKCGVSSDTPPTSADRSAYNNVYEGSQEIDWTITEAEITAWMNSENQPGYWPFSSAQVKIHPDNVIEVSFVINPIKLLTYPSVLKFIPGDIKSYIARIPLQLPMYAKAQVSFAGPRQVDIQMLEFDASGMSVSNIALSEQTNQILEGILNEEFALIELASFDVFDTGEGSLHMQGTWYTELTRVPNE